jgi:hypothetical protein
MAMTAAHYVTWIARHARSIIAAHVAVFGLSIYLIGWHLPLLADFAYLLPADAPAVRDLRRIESRVKSADALLVVVEAPAPAARADAVRELAEGIRALPPALIDQVEEDDVAVRDFVRANRHLYVPLDDIARGRDTLRREIDAAKLAANPIATPGCAAITRARIASRPSSIWWPRTISVEPNAIRTSSIATRPSALTWPERSSRASASRRLSRSAVRPCCVAAGSGSARSM